MNALVWLFWGMTTVITWFITKRVTAWYYKKQIKAIKKKHNIIT